MGREGILITMAGVTNHSKLSGLINSHLFLIVSVGHEFRKGTVRMGLAGAVNCIFIVVTIRDIAPRASISRTSKPGGSYITFYDLALEVRKLQGLP